jgi:hypothetical protein
MSVLVALLERIHQHATPVTWAFSDPAGTSLARRRIAGEMPQQEIALLIDQTSRFENGSLDLIELSRSELVRGVARRLQLAAAAGISITSLAVRGAWNPQHFDLLTKHGITMIRSRGAELNPAHSKARHGISRLDGAGARAVCYGLWQVPVSIVVHGGGWMSNTLQSLRLVRIINRTAARGGLCHVQIDAAALAAGDVSQGLHTVDRLLRCLDHWRTAGRIRVETLRATAQRLLPKRSESAHSILRAA